MQFPVFEVVAVTLGKADILGLAVIALILVGCVFCIRNFFKH